MNEQDKVMKFRADTEQDRAEIEAEAQKKRIEFASMDLNTFFEGFIKEGQFTEESDFGNGMKVTVKPLNMGELIEAEAIIRNSNPNIPMDSMVKLRAASILSKAITKIGDSVIERSDMTEEQISMRRFTLYAQLIKMPPSLITKMYAFYLEVVKKQDEYYTMPIKDVLDKNEDFSTAPSEE